MAVFVFFFYFACIVCFLSFVCFSGLFAMLPKKKENNKTRAIFVCGLMFSLCLYVCPRFTDF